MNSKIVNIRRHDTTLMDNFKLRAHILFIVVTNRNLNIHFLCFCPKKWLVPTSEIFYSPIYGFVLKKSLRH